MKHFRNLVCFACFIFSTLAFSEVEYHGPKKIPQETQDGFLEDSQTSEVLQAKHANKKKKLLFRSVSQLSSILAYTVSSALIILGTFHLGKSLGSHSSANIDSKKETSAVLSVVKLGHIYKTRLCESYTDFETIVNCIMGILPPELRDPIFTPKASINIRARKDR